MHLRVGHFAVLLPVFAASALHAQEGWLGPPPTAPTTVTPAEIAPLAGPQGNAGPSYYDTTNREAVRTAFNSTWLPSRSAPIAWTGTAAGCAEGTISQQWNDAALTGLNFLRNLAGIAGALTFDAGNNAKDQKAALMFSVNKQLSHTPPASWTCYTADAATAAGKSNICLQPNNPTPGCLELYMDDFGTNNTFVGHRRWIVYPQTQTLGNGDVPANGSNFPGNALWAYDDHFGGPRPATRDPWVPWPSAGYFPYQLVPNRWSFSYANAIFSGASVTMTKDGVAVPLTLEAVVNGYAENTIVFYPTGADVTRPTVPVKPAADTTYTVTISNVLVSGTPQTITYSVTVFDPAVESPGPNPGCTYGLSPGGQAFGPAGGSGTINITTGPGCVWTLSDIPSWITPTSSMSGVASGLVSYQVAANAGASRSAAMTITNTSFAFEQQGSAPVAGLNFVGAMAHLAAQENWTTAFTLVNKGAGSAQSRLSLFADPAGTLTLPLTFPQQPAQGSFLAASFDRMLGANASLIVNTAGPQTGQVLQGSAQLAATGPVDGFAIFRQIPTEQEAVVPMETRDAPSYLLAFDNTNGLVLGVAVENISSLGAVIPVVIRDDAGVLISAPGATISLGGSGHTAFVLSTQFPVTANKRGTIEFKRPVGGRISVLGLRFTPPNNALTTIPALANVLPGGGSIAHLASGGDGWETTFVLVNTGTSAAQITLSFFADETGSPLFLPLSFPQPGGGTNTMASSVQRLLAAGATLIVQSSGAPQLLTGSAQLTTAGNVSGFVIFRHNNQEAVVPLESRNASGYIIAFDNTGGTATGVALNVVSAQQVNVPVVVRNDAGTQIGATDTITLAANGHYAFTLVHDRYPGTANIRGTLEFGKPANAQIGALGIRIPNGAVTTYTTLPALAK